MAKVVPNAGFDEGLAHDTNFNRVAVCAGQPTSFADIAARALAVATIAAPTIGAGSPDGRQSNMAAANNIVIATSGTADHIAYYQDAGSRYVVTTCSSTALVANGTNSVSVGAGSRRIGAVA